MKSAKHTPTPWEPGPTGGRGISTVDAFDPVDGQLFAVCEVFGVNAMNEACEVSQANAAFIVRAVNSYEPLVEFFNASVAWTSIAGHEDATVEDERKAEARYGAALAAARAALAAAGA